MTLTAASFDCEFIQLCRSNKNEEPIFFRNLKYIFTVFVFIRHFSIWWHQTLVCQMETPVIVLN